MKTQLYLLTFYFLFSATASLAQDSALIGSQSFAQECSSCHIDNNGDPLEDERIPSLKALQSLPANAIYTALNTGKMALQGQALTILERIAVAEFLTQQKVDVSAANNPFSFLCDKTSDLNASITQPAWNGWGADLSNSRYQASQAAKLTAEQIPHLELAWSFGFVDALAARTQPTIIGTWLFTAGGNGEVFALDTNSGCTHWVFQARSAVRTAMTVVRSNNKHTIYFGDGQANVYAVNAQTGELLWTVKVDDHPNAAITGAPSVFQGRVYIPVSAAGEEVRGPNADYGCCTFKGSVSALDTNTGSLLWKTYTITDEQKPRGLSANGVTLYGPAGVGIWNSPTIDPQRGLLYVGTGNSFADPAQATSDAILAMDLESGVIQWVKQTIPNDVWLWQCDAYNAASPNCPEKQGPDYDFSASPILQTTSNGQALILTAQKSGVIYAMDPDNQGSVIWQYRISNGSALSGQWGGASDGHNLYIGVANPHAPEPGGIHAIDLESGQTTWFAEPQPLLCKGGPKEFCSAAQGGAISAIPGAIFSGSFDGGIRAFATEDGSLLWEYDTNRDFQTVNGVSAKGASMDASGPVIVNGMVFINSGYNGLVSRAGNVLLAFRIADGQAQ